MKKNIFYIFITMVLTTIPSFAQNDSIHQLDEVVLSDIKIKKFSEGYKIQKISDSTIKKNETSLTSLLRYNSTIFFRENGVGGTSSASFRGTSASQTAVIWNGININSQLNGQTDFNTINSNSFDTIDIRSGGGSVQYGSGAIGGSIHLNNNFDFSNHLRNNLMISYGSFDAYKLNYDLDFGSENMYAGIGVNYHSSENDYKYLGTEFRNQNGAFSNISFNGNFGMFLSDNHLIKMYHHSFLGERNFSGILSGSSLSPSNDSYEDINSRTLLTWKYFNKSYTSKLSIANLHEMYRYYDNQDLDTYDFGKSNNFIAKYDFLYYLNEDIYINAIIDNAFIQGEGTNFGNDQDRNILSGIFLLKHRLNKQIDYGVNLRQEYTNLYDSPLLFAFDIKYKPSKYYLIKLNSSRNYRIPTYNDLYWVGAGGIGNPDVIPETSLQAEIEQQVNFNSILFSISGYYIKAKDLIKWIPVSGSTWSPVNVESVVSSGLELSVNYNKKWENHAVVFQSNYGYTISEDTEKDKQLIYVPFHKATASLSYTYKRFSGFYQFLYNGSVFITTDNTRKLEGYDVSNVGVSYTWLHSGKKELVSDFRINNLYNRNYQNVGFRPMPNRNYQIQLTFKF